MGLSLENNTATNIPVFDRASGFERFRPVPTAINDDTREIDCNGSFNKGSGIFGDEGSREREVALPDLVPPPPLGERTRHVEIAAANDADIDQPQPRQRATFKPSTCGL